MVDLVLGPSPEGPFGHEKEAGELPAPSIWGEGGSGLDGQLDWLDGRPHRGRLCLWGAVGAGRTRDADLEHSAVVHGFDLALLDALGQRDVALEETVAGLLSVVAGFLDLLVELALAGHSKLTRFELDVDVLGVHARQVHPHDPVSVAREDVGGRGAVLAGSRRKQRTERPRAGQRAEELRKRRVEPNELI